MGKKTTDASCVALCGALVGSFAFAGGAAAFEIDTGNPDLRLTVDNTFRYNTAVRVNDPDPGIANNLLFDESDYSFGKGQMTTNRVDLYSELDLKYKNLMGLRVSGQAWYDSRYGGSANARPGSTLAQRNIKDGGVAGAYDSEVRRYYHGPSAEFLDYFVWGQAKVGEGDILGRIGGHSVIWGEGVVGSGQSVAYSQQPNDGRKSAQSPGASAKETALPVNQTTGTWQFRPDASLSWQYQFEWKPNRASLGGTYYGGADIFSPIVSGSPSIPRAPAEEGERGSRGLMLKLRPQMVDGEFGVIYRQFSDTNPWAAQFSAGAGTPGVTGRAVYARDVSLWGLTYSTTVKGVAVGAELSHRSNMALNSVAGGASANNAGSTGRYEGAIGDTWHGLINATFLFNKTPLFDTASLLAEVQFASLDKVTRNGAFYKSSSNPLATTCINGRDEVLNGCSSNNFVNLALVFTPTWQQVRPGLDVALQTTYVVGLNGTSPANGGGNKSSGQYKVNLGFDYNGNHKLDIAYLGYLGRTEYGVAGTANPPAASGGQPVYYTVGGGALADRDTLSLTYTYNF